MTPKFQIDPNTDLALLHDRPVLRPDSDRALHHRKRLRHAAGHVHGRRLGGGHAARHPLAIAAGVHAPGHPLVIAAGGHQPPPVGDGHGPQEVELVVGGRGVLPRKEGMFAENSFRLDFKVLFKKKKSPNEGNRGRVMGQKANFLNC